jgi:paired amphipathic helix protein Sin3a
MPTIHSPGGLLANHGGTAPSIPLGASSGSSAPFGGPLHGEAGRAPPHGGPPVGSGPQHQIFAPIQHGPGAPNGAVNGSNGPSSLFGGSLQQDAPRGGPPEAGRALQHMPFPPGVSGASPMPAPGMPAAGAGGLPQGQQPILNVSLVRFGDRHALQLTQDSLLRTP